MLHSKQKLLDAMAEAEAEAGFEVSPASLIRLVVGWMDDLELRVEEVDDDCANLSAATAKRIARLEAQAAMLQAHIDLLVAASTRVKDDSPANRAAYRKALDAYRTAADYYVSLEEPE